MDAYNINQAHQAPYTVRTLSPTSPRNTLGNLFLEPSLDNTFHENGDQFANGNHADNASSTRAILVSSRKCSSYTTNRSNNAYSSEDPQAPVAKTFPKRASVNISSRTHHYLLHTLAEDLDGLFSTTGIGCSLSL